MLWEVGPDALESMQNSSTVALVHATRADISTSSCLNPSGRRRSRQLKIPPSAQRGVDRDRDRQERRLNGYGIASELARSGPSTGRSSRICQKFEFDPAAAARALGKPLKLTCSDAS